MVQSINDKVDLLIDTYKTQVSDMICDYLSREDISLRKTSNKFGISRRALSGWIKKNSVASWKSYFSLATKIDENRPYGSNEERIMSLEENLGEYVGEKISAYCDGKGVSIEEFCTQVGLPKRKLSERKNLAEKLIPKTVFKILTYTMDTNQRPTDILKPIIDVQYIESKIKHKAYKSLVHRPEEDTQFADKFIDALKSLEMAVKYFRESTEEERDKLRGRCEVREDMILLMEARTLLREEEEYQKWKMWN